MKNKLNILPFPETAQSQNFGRFLIPEKITDARKAERLTQKKLAEMVGVTRAAISYFESGERRPDPLTVVKIAEALNQPVKYFTTPTPLEFGKRSPNFFRQHGAKTKKKNEASDKYAAWFAQSAYAFDKYVNFPKVNLPSFEPSNSSEVYSWEELDDLAQKTREHMGLGLGPISNTIRLVESHGVIVGRLILENENVSAFSFWSGDRPFVFLASDKKSAARARYDVCHELAHLVLHRWVTTEEIEDKDRLKVIESEANYFAGAFLLPFKSFPNEVFSPRLSGFEHLKGRWKTSIQAMVKRCKDLGIFDEYQCTNLYKEISRRKWRTNEPLDSGPNALPVEEPMLLRKVAEAVFGSGAISPDEFAALLSVNPNIIASLIGVPKSVFEETDPSEVEIDLK